MMAGLRFPGRPGVRFNNFEVNYWMQNKSNNDKRDANFEREKLCSFNSLFVEKCQGVIYPFRGFTEADANNCLQKLQHAQSKYDEIFVDVSRVDHDFQDSVFSDESESQLGPSACHSFYGDGYCAPQRAKNKKDTLILAKCVQDKVFVKKSIHSLIEKKDFSSAVHADSRSQKKNSTSTREATRLKPHISKKISSQPSSASDRIVGRTKAKFQCKSVSVNASVAKKNVGAKISPARKLKGTKKSKNSLLHIQVRQTGFISKHSEEVLGLCAKKQKISQHLTSEKSKSPVTESTKAPSGAKSVRYTMKEMLNKYNSSFSNKNSSIVSPLSKSKESWLAHSSTKLTLISPNSRILKEQILGRNKKVDISLPEKKVKQEVLLEETVMQHLQSFEGTVSVDPADITEPKIPLFHQPCLQMGKRKRKLTQKIEDFIANVHQRKHKLNENFLRKKKTDLRQSKHLVQKAKKQLGRPIGSKSNVSALKKKPIYTKKAALKLNRGKLPVCEICSCKIRLSTIGHYGHILCNSCRTFYRNKFHTLDKIPVCEHKGKCKDLRACLACRLDKMFDIIGDITNYSRVTTKLPSKAVKKELLLRKKRAKQMAVESKFLEKTGTKRKEMLVEEMPSKLKRRSKADSSLKGKLGTKSVTVHRDVQTSSKVDTKHKNVPEYKDKLETKAIKKENEFSGNSEALQHDILFNDQPKIKLENLDLDEGVNVDTSSQNSTNLTNSARTRNMCRQAAHVSNSKLKSVVIPVQKLQLTLQRQGRGRPPKKGAEMLKKVKMGIVHSKHGLGKALKLKKNATMTLQQKQAKKAIARPTRVSNRPKHMNRLLFSDEYEFSNSLEAHSEILTSKEFAGEPKDEVADSENARPTYVNTLKDKHFDKGIQGPRIKHVCRSFEAVMGQPTSAGLSELNLSALPQEEKDKIERPSDDSDGEWKPPNKSSSPKKKFGKPIVVKQSGGFGRRRIRCKKCPPCLKPDCRDCYACRDMIKYGGPGTIKKGCIKRICLNPVYGNENKKPAVSYYKPRNIIFSNKRKYCQFNKGPKVNANLLCNPQVSLEKLDDTLIADAQSSSKDNSALVSTAQATDVDRPTFFRKNLTKQYKDISASPGKQHGPLHSYKPTVLWKDWEDQDLEEPRLLKVDYVNKSDEDSLWANGECIISVGLQLTGEVCYLCASIGHHQLYSCQVCCEPFHEFCLEDGEKPLPGKGWSNWICPKCLYCDICGQQEILLQCDTCHLMYHPSCIGKDYPQKPSKHKQIWLCNKCVHCKSCGATTPGQDRDARWMCDFTLCQRCALLRYQGHYCPVCKKCYENDDYDCEMVECNICNRWFHATCENLTDEMYNSLSFLPEQIPYSCQLCTTTRPTEWEEALMVYRQQHLCQAFEAFKKGEKVQSIMQHLVSKPKADESRCASSGTATNCEKGAHRRTRSLAAKKFESTSTKICTNSSCTVSIVPCDAVAADCSSNSYAIAHDVLTSVVDYVASDGNYQTDNFRNATSNQSTSLSYCNRLHRQDYELYCEKVDVARYVLKKLLKNVFQEVERRNELKRPITLQDVQKKLRLKQYKSVDEFCYDMNHLIHCAANSFSSPLGNVVTSLTFTFSKIMQANFPWYNPKNAKYWAKAAMTSPSSSALQPPHGDHNYAGCAAADDDSDRTLSTSIISPQATGSASSPRSPEHVSPKKPLDDFSSPLSFRSKDKRKCSFCLKFGDGLPNDAGRLLYLGHNEWGHINCILWSSEVYEDSDGMLHDVEVAASRGRHCKCAVCGAPGATVGCCARGCPNTFHFPCAKKSRALFQEDKKVFCYDDRMLSDGMAIEMDEFAVKRRVSVRHDPSKWNKYWQRGVEPKTACLVAGSMTVEALGTLDSVSNTDEALYPVDYVCKRVYWSIHNPTNKCVYTMRIRKVEPKEEEPVNVEHVTTAHGQSSSPLKERGNLYNQQSVEYVNNHAVAKSGEVVSGADAVPPVSIKIEQQHKVDDTQHYPKVLSSPTESPSCKSDHEKDIKTGNESVTSASNKGQHHTLSLEKPLLGFDLSTDSDSADEPSDDIGPSNFSGSSGKLEVGMSPTQSFSDNEDSLYEINNSTQMKVKQDDIFNDDVPIYSKEVSVCHSIANSDDEKCFDIKGIKHSFPNTTAVERFPNVNVTVAKTGSVSSLKSDLPLLTYSRLKRKSRLHADCGTKSERAHAESASDSNSRNLRLSELNAFDGSDNSTSAKARKYENLKDSSLQVATAALSKKHDTSATSGYNSHSSSDSVVNSLPNSALGTFRTVNSESVQTVTPVRKEIARLHFLGTVIIRNKDTDHLIDTGPVLVQNNFADDANVDSALEQINVNVDPALEQNNVNVYPAFEQSNMNVDPALEQSNVINDVITAIQNDHGYNDSSNPIAVRTDHSYGMSGKTPNKERKTKIKRKQVHRVKEIEEPICQLDSSQLLSNPAKMKRPYKKFRKQPATNAVSDVLPSDLQHANRHSLATEDELLFELCSEDGFHTVANSIEDAWKVVVEQIQKARATHNMNSISFAGLSGIIMLGVISDPVCYLLEQLPGAQKCCSYQFRYHQYDRMYRQAVLKENPSGCARTERFQQRGKYDMFSWLASRHRKRPISIDKSAKNTELQLKSSRRPTSMSSLPMAMRFRHLSLSAKEAVGVYRSRIHGRGLFCKRDIDEGEMIIEYAGQVIRSSVGDKRDLYYQSKHIGCYMFRIDNWDLIDATMYGNAARFINHSCEPNCYSKVINVDGNKHIVIFALRAIQRGEELTYDYKFPYEDTKIPCTCGAKKCRQYLN